MKYLLYSSLLSALLLNVVIATELLKFLTLPQHDRVSRVCQLTATNANDRVANLGNAGLIVIIKDSSKLADVVEQQLCRDNFAETAAQLLEKRNVSVCELSLINGITSATAQKTIGNVGDIVVYYGGKRYLYYGRRDPTALLSFILKLGTSPVQVITGKLDKVAYDLVPGPKLVGFFMPATPELAVFEEAAQQYSPSIPFYVALDRVVAKHLKLTTVGQINLVKPFEKQSIPMLVNPATRADIDAFINSNSGVILQELNEHNIYDPQLQNPNKTTFLAIGERSSAIGGYFHRIVTRAIRNITRDNDRIAKASLNIPTLGSTLTVSATPVNPEPTIPLDNVEILWIDPQVFPTVYVMMDQLERHYRFPPGLPVYFGVYNVSSNESVWFNSVLLNTTADKQADDTNVLLLRQWIVSVINNTVSSLPSAGVQAFIKEPTDVTAAPNSNFVLECVVEYQVGDCLWLHDGQNIGFNLARHWPHYSWRGDNINGDCSLVVTGALAGRDDGEWVCEVTGDQNSETITSFPALVTVQSPTVVKRASTPTASAGKTSQSNTVKAEL